LYAFSTGVRGIADIFFCTGLSANPLMTAYRRDHHFS